MWHRACTLASYKFVRLLDSLVFVVKVGLRDITGGGDPWQVYTGKYPVCA